MNKQKKETLDLMIKAFHNNHYIPEFHRQIEMIYNELKPYMNKQELTKYNSWMENTFYKVINSNDIKEKLEAFRNHYEVRLEEYINNFMEIKDNKFKCNQIETDWGLYWGFSLYNKSEKYNKIYNFMKNVYSVNFIKNNFGGEEK